MCIPGYCDQGVSEHPGDFAKYDISDIILSLEKNMMLLLQMEF